MPGPKMGPRPTDFNEDIVRRSPTFIKWEKLQDGEKLRYACREFIKGHGDDEERLMRRIMIARRNNLRDHEVLKRARQTEGITEDSIDSDQKDTKVESTTRLKKRRGTTPGCLTCTDSQVLAEMDVTAVEATRSYKKWETLEPGTEFVYNQKYIKGKDGHDWLLKKNIWRRMRYRRENKKIVQKLKGDEATTKTTTTTVTTGVAAAATTTAAAANAATATPNDSSMVAADVVDQALLAGASVSAASGPPETDDDTNVINTTVEPTLAAKVEETTEEGHDEFDHKAVVEAAVAAAETYVKEQTTAAVAAATAAVAAANVVGGGGGGVGVGDVVGHEHDASLASIAAMSVPPSSAMTDLGVHNPLEAAATNEALDAAAKLAAATAPPTQEQSDDDGKALAADFGLKDVDINMAVI